MSSEEINQLREKVKNTIDSEGIDKLCDTLAIQANSALQSNRSQDLNSLDFAVLKLMMIDYLRNNFQ